MTETTTLAVAQTAPRRGDVAANLAEHLALLELAATEGVGVLVFPELSLTGYELDLAEELAFLEEDPRIEPLRSAVDSTGVRLVVGAPIRLGASLHIGAFLLGPGRTLEVYTKERLGVIVPGAPPSAGAPPPEGDVFVSGTLHPGISLSDGPAAIAICADAGHPGHATRAAEGGSSRYLVSAFVLPGELEAEVRRLRETAVRHSMTVGLANYGGPSGGLPSGGRSALWSPGGEVVAQLESVGVGLALAMATPRGWTGRTLSMR